MSAGGGKKALYVLVGSPFHHAYVAAAKGSEYDCLEKRGKTRNGI